MSNRSSPKSSDIGALAGIENPDNYKDRFLSYGKAAANNANAFAIPPRLKPPPAHAVFSQNASHNEPMSTMTREELDTKFELLNTRSDARARETQLQAEARLARFEERIDQSIGEMRRDRADTLKKIDDLQTEVRSESKSLKITAIVTAVASVIAIVGGIAAFNATVLGNMTASFESGKNTADAIAKAADQLRQSQELSAKTAETLKQAGERLVNSPTQK